MRLAILDANDEVLLSWPTVADAHDHIADQFAAKVAPRRWQTRKRKRLAAGLVAHLLELQKQTTRL